MLFSYHRSHFEEYAWFMQRKPMISTFDLEKKVTGLQPWNLYKGQQKLSKTINLLDI